MRKPSKQRPVLVALRDLDRSAVPVLRKAAMLAKALAAPIRLIHVVAVPHSSMALTAASVRGAIAAEMGDRKKDLQKLAASAELRGIKTSICVRMDYPAADALVREALLHRPQMLLAQSHRYGRFARLWLSNTDWELIRHCPCPLWLSKSNRFSRSSSVIAAVDPLHAHAKPAVLDDIIVRHAVQAANGQRKRVFVVHAYDPGQAAGVGAVEAYWIAMSPHERQAYEAALKKQIERLRLKHDIPSGNAIIATGDPLIQLPRMVRKLGAGLVVMGAVSRRGLQRLFIGHTAERVIDELSCDVLVVKPTGFKSLVSRRTGGMRSLRRST